MFPSRLASKIAIVVLTAVAAVFDMASPAHAQPLSISGEVRYHSTGAPIGGVEVRLTGPAMLFTHTDAGGRYSFAGLSQGTWRVEPRLVGSVSEAISALDASYVLRHAVALQELESTERLACDVNGDGVVGAFDASQILQLTVGVLSRFPVAQICQSDWLFLPLPAPAANQSFSTPQAGATACTPGAITFQPLVSTVTAQDFVAVVIGDCTGDGPGPGTPLPTLTRTTSPTPTATGAAPATTTATASASPTLTPSSPPSATRTASRTPTPTATPTPATQPQVTIGPPIGGLGLPVYVIHAGDGSQRLFVVSQDGYVRLLRNGVLQATPFLDIHTKVSCCGERGLLSIAFPPGYTSKRYFYVNYTDTAGTTVVARYRLTDDVDVADAASEEVILRVAQPYSNHNGGQLAFGPDGYLYIGMGDGGSGGDPQNNGQSMTTLLGKILRIDVEQPSPNGTPTPYVIPASNPPSDGTPGYRREIWASGVRNPWRFSFDRLTGDLYIGDVGQGAWEEIDFQPSSSPGGENYGWRVMEGAHCYNPSSCNPAGFTLPVWEYAHGTGDCSVSGGFVYRGSAYACLHGTYVYGDYCSGRIWGLRRVGNVWSNAILSDAPFNITSFGEDEVGNLWVADYGAGAIRALSAACSPAG